MNFTDLTDKQDTRPAKTGAAPSTGFTLIELMIVVAIIGILASIAFPSYLDSVRKSRRTLAKTALLNLASGEEKHYSLNNTYANAATLGITTEVKDGSGNTLYNLAIVTVADAAAIPATPTIPETESTPATPSTPGTAAKQAGFSATATPAGNQAEDTCAIYRINSLGQQTNHSLSGSKETAINAGCW